MGHMNQPTTKKGVFVRRVFIDLPRQHCLSVVGVINLPSPPLKGVDVGVEYRSSHQHATDLDPWHLRQDSKTQHGTILHS